MAKSSRAIIWRVAQVVLIGVIIFFMGRQIVTNWSEISSFRWQLNAVYLGFSVILVVAALFVFSTTWKLIIKSLGSEIPVLKAFKIAFLANLGRYIPGKIWQVFGIIYMAKKEGVSEEESVASFGLTQIFAIPSGLLVGLLGYWLFHGGDQTITHKPVITGGMALAAVGIAAVSLMIVFFPRPIERLANLILTKMRRRPIKLHMHKSLAAAIYAGYFLAWSLYGVAFWVFLRGVSPVDSPVIAVVGIFNIAYQIGYLVILAPGGMGPREAVITILLAPYYTQPVAAAIAIASRLWVIAAETIAALIALRIK